MIIGLVGSRLRVLFKVKILQDRSASSQEIMKHLRTGSAWYADRMSKISGSLSFKEYSKLFRVLLEHEYMLKTTSVESSAFIGDADYFDGELKGYKMRCCLLV